MPSSDQIVWTSRAEPLAEARLERERPRGVDAAAERRQQHEPPVAELVAEALDDDPPVGRQRAGRPRARPRGRRRGSRPPARRGRGASRSRASRGRPASGAAAEVGLDLADERPERPPELDRPADGVAVPERQLAGHARRRRHGDPVVADLLDPPAARAERDDLAGPALVDHLLVELADPPAGRPGLADHEHAVQPAVRDRPAARDGDDPRVAPALDDVGDAVPDDARLQLGELVATGRRRRACRGRPRGPRG